jgi:transposase-like protein
MPIILGNIAKEAILYTDEASHYTRIGREFAHHDFTTHKTGEYVRGDVHTNTVEGYFSVFKRGMKGVYQHCGKAHLHRYLAEYEFRYNNRKALGVEDSQRADNVLSSVSGKRLSYKLSA